MTSELFRLRFRIPLLARMRRATSFTTFWNSVPNEQVHGFQSLFEDATGQSLVIMHETSRELWQEFRPLIGALGDAAATLDYIFDATGTLYDPGNRRPMAMAVSKLADRLSALPHGPKPDFMVASMSAILSQLSVALGLARLRPGTTNTILNEVVHLELAPLSQSEAPPQFLDVFISYKHAAYKAAALELYQELKSLGVECWLDQHHLQLPPSGFIERRTLQALLVAAIEHARCTVFFETYDIAHANEDARGGHTRYSWQGFEWRHTRRVALVRLKSRVLELDGSREPIPFSDIRQLAKVIANYSKQLSATADERLPSRRPVQAPLHECFARLEEEVANYFGGGVRATVPTALALLCPGESDSHGGQFVTTAADVLVRLIRLSPFCGLRVEQAGLDVHELCRVGLKLTDVNWRMPTSLLLPDLMGKDDRGPETARVRECGTLDEAGLLAALVERGCESATYGNELLIRVLKQQYGDIDVPAARARLNSIRERLTAAIARRPSRFRDQRWVVHEEAGKWYVRPFATAGAYAIDVGEGEPFCAQVNLAHTDDLFDQIGIAGFEDLLAAGPDAAAVDAFMSAHPDLRALMETTGAGSVETIAEISEATGGGLIFLEPLDERAPMAASARGSVGKRLTEGLQMLRTSGRGPKPSQALQRISEAMLVPLRTRAALVIGQRETAGRDDAERISLLDFHAAVLAPLWRQVTVRQLDYDAFEV